MVFLETQVSYLQMRTLDVLSESVCFNIYKVLLPRGVSHMITDWYMGSFVTLRVVSWKKQILMGACT